MARRVSILKVVASYEDQTIGSGRLHRKHRPIARRKKVFKQLLNPKAYATAIYALTWKTRIQRERRILCSACMYTSHRERPDFPRVTPLYEKKNSRNVSCNHQPKLSPFRLRHKTFKQVRDTFPFLKLLFDNCKE